MTEAKTLEAAKRRRSRVRAPRRRKPLEKNPGEKLLGDAERWMGRALKLRNTEPMRAVRYAERAAGFYLAASKRAGSTKERADLLVGAGKALSFAAKMCEKKDPRRAGRFHGEAGDNFYAGARHETRPEAEVKRLAREHYERALELGGNIRILVRKIGTCERVSGEE